MIRENLLSIKQILPPRVKLVAVSKTHPPEKIMEAYQAGQRMFGENRVQELLNKQPQLPADVEWHLIGHLQTNKVKAVIPHVSLIHSVDSAKLFFAINKEAANLQIRVNCLLQFHIATEETKYGFDYLEAADLIDQIKNIPDLHVVICGVMGMATFTEDEELIRKEFKTLKSYFDLIKEKYYPGSPVFSEISMGMSDDYQIAVEEGSTMVRIGSSVFGERKYGNKLL